MESSLVSERSADNRLEMAVAALAGRIARWTENGELHTNAVPGLSLFRRVEPTEPISGMYEPSICLAVQGAKRVILGDDTFVSDSKVSVQW